MECLYEKAMYVIFIFEIRLNSLRLYFYGYAIGPKVLLYSMLQVKVKWTTQMADINLGEQLTYSSGWNGRN